MACYLQNGNDTCGERMWRNWNPCAGGWECKMIQMPWKTVCWFLKNIELLCDPGIPLLGIHPKELKAGTGADICTPMSTAALFTVAKRWKQPSVYRQNNGGMDKDTMGYYSNIKGYEILAYLQYGWTLKTLH